MCAPARLHCVSHNRNVLVACSPGYAWNFLESKPYGDPYSWPQDYLYPRGEFEKMAANNSYYTYHVAQSYRFGWNWTSWGGVSQLGCTMSTPVAHGRGLSGDSWDIATGGPCP